MNRKVDDKFIGIKDIYVLQCICSELKKQLQQKEKSINKAIRLLNKYRNRKDTWGLWCMEYGDNAEIIKILGGKVSNNGR